MLDVEVTWAIAEVEIGGLEAVFLAAKQDTEAVFGGFAGRVGIGKDADLADGVCQCGDDAGGGAKDVEDDGDSPFELAWLEVRWEKNDISPHVHSLACPDDSQKHAERPESCDSRRSVKKLALGF